MLALTHFGVISEGIVALTGLEYATNLKLLWLWDNQISNVSALSGLMELMDLDLSGNQISDVSALSGLMDLTDLDLSGNQISDVSALSGLTDLTDLDLSGNQISDVSPLSGPTDLRRLDMCDNQISDISGLSGLTGLRLLWLNGNALNNAAYTTYIPMIIANNPGIDIRYDPPLTLQNPNGGEVLVAGQIYPITWTNASSISDVLIEYSTNNGGNWTPVDPPNTGNTGSYNWLVPQVSSIQCLIRISDSSNPSTSDTSDDVFTIEGQADLEITSEDITFDPIPGVPGQPSTISATVWNVGNIPAVNIGVSFTDSSGPIGSNSISILDPGDYNTVSIQHSWPDTGYQLITVTVDGPNNIEEMDETNDTASKVYQIGDPAEANAILDVSWNSAPACYTEGTSVIIRGKADYRIEITGTPDIVSAALGSIVTAQITDSNGVVTNLQSTLTGPGGYFYIPFIVPDADEGSFTIEISVTDGTLTGIWEKLFCIKPVIITPTKDLWICDLTLNDETPDVGVPVNVCATICAAPDNDETVLDVPVTFYAYPPTGGAYQIGSTTVIDQIVPGDSNSVCVDWTPTVNGLHRIRAIIGPGFSDDNNGNNYRYYNVTVGMFTVSASPRWAAIGQQVQITVDSRELLPSDQLDSITVLDSAAQPIQFSPADPCHPSPTRWVYQTDPLPAGIGLGTATITVAGTDSGSVQHAGEGYFQVYEILPDFWLHSCDVNFSDLNPDLGEPITIDAVVHADSSNPETESDIPVTFYSKHLPSGGDYIEISQTQYTDAISPDGVSTPVSVPWQNAAKGEYVIKVQLGPGFSDKTSGNNATTRAILVGNNIPFDVEFEVVNKTRTGRWEFEYECNIRMYNQTDLTLENIQLELTGVSSNMTLINPYTAAFADIGPKGSALSENICTFSVDRLIEIDSAQINWDLTYQIVDICGIMQQTSSSTIILGSGSDITGEGDVDWADLRILAEQWLQPPGIPSADIAPEPVDGIVNFLDFAVLAEDWMK